MARPSHEFETPSSDVTWKHKVERGLRCLSLARSMAFEPEAVASMGVASLSVLSLGIAEGALLSRKGSPGRLKFCLRYGFGQVLPSVIWATKPAELVARRALMEPSSVLVEKLSAGRESKVLTLSTLRSIIAGFVGIAQILRLVDIGGESQALFAGSVLAGKEPLMGGVKER